MYDEDKPILETTSADQIMVCVPKLMSEKRIRAFAWEATNFADWEIDWAITIKPCVGRPSCVHVYLKRGG
jgi:hypothetical protein